MFVRKQQDMYGSNKGWIHAWMIIDFPGNRKHFRSIQSHLFVESKFAKSFHFFSKSRPGFGKPSKNIAWDLVELLCGWSKKNHPTKHLPRNETQMILTGFHRVLYVGDTVDGRNPVNHLGCLKPWKSWDKLPNSTGAGFLPSTVFIMWPFFT